MKRYNLVFAMGSLLVLAPSAFATGPYTNSPSGYADSQADAQDQTQDPPPADPGKSYGYNADFSSIANKTNPFNKISRDAKLSRLEWEAYKLKLQNDKLDAQDGTTSVAAPAPVVKTMSDSLADTGKHPLTFEEWKAEQTKVTAPAPVAAAPADLDDVPGLNKWIDDQHKEWVAAHPAQTTTTPAAVPAATVPAVTTPVAQSAAPATTFAYHSNLATPDYSAKTFFSKAVAPANPDGSGGAPSDTSAAPAAQAAAAAQPQAQTPPAAQADATTQATQQAADQTSSALDALNQQHQDVAGSVPCTDDQAADANHRYDDKASAKLRAKGNQRAAKLDAAFADLIQRSKDDASNSDKAKFWQKVENKDYTLPAKLASKANCIMVIPGEKSVAFGSLGFTYGAGAYKCKDSSADGGWGPVQYVQSEGLSKGFQIGGKDTDRVLFFDGPDAIKQLESSTVNVCAGAAVAAGPVGRDAQACTDSSLKGIVSYSSTKGLFAGISLQGVRIHPDKNMDALENNQEVSMQKRHWYTLGLRAGHRNICQMASDSEMGNPSGAIGGASALDLSQLGSKAKSAQ